MMYVLQIQSNTKNVRELEPFLAEVVKDVGMDATRYHNTIIALTEGVNNAIIHGNKRDESKMVTVTAAIEDGVLVITLEDYGDGFNPDTLPDPLAPENLLKDGGRGVFLMRTLMDSAEFFRVEGGSRTVLRTRLMGD